MTIGERIRSLRYAREYPQSFLADSVGIKKQTLYKYENGIITNIPIDNLIAIANALGVSPAYLIGCDEESQAEKWIHVFYDRLDTILSNIDGAMPEDLDFDIYKLLDIAERKPQLTLQEAYEISIEIGVSFLFLCGITDAENAEQPTPVAEDGLDDMEKLLMRYVKDLTEDQKQMLLAQMQVMIEAQKKSPISSGQRSEDGMLPES